MVIHLRGWTEQGHPMETYSYLLPYAAGFGVILVYASFRHYQQGKREHYGWLTDEGQREMVFLLRGIVAVLEAILLCLALILAALIAK
jgi:hypothetical protein